MLDALNESLWKGSEKIRLRPKTFAFLQYLIARPGQLVTKDQLLSVLWQNCHVGDEALKHCVAEIRKALNDSAETPRFIETVHRRGYRFIGEMGQDLQGVDSNWRDRKPDFSACQLVGRTSELAQLDQYLEKAMEGVRQVIFVTGEQGIGKTALVDAFLNLANAEPHTQDGSENSIGLWGTRGQCIKSHGAGEAYMPFWEALTGLCQTPNRVRVAAVLRQHAPLWILQMPSLVSAAQLRNVRRATLGATRERMLREMAEALEALTVDIPMILVLEDLHWSDYSTLDLISYWAQRRAPSRLMLIATYRPAEALADNHPLKTIKQDLQAHQQCREIPLTFLDEAAVAEYLTQRFPNHGFPAEMTTWIHGRTEGNPLFMTNVLDHLVTRGLIVQRNHRWILDATLEKAGLEVPPTIQQMIEQQVDQCSLQEQRLLQAASVEGVEFSAVAVAVALGEKADRVDARCRKLAVRNQLLQPAGIRQTAGGRRIACYRFIHALYQSICYQLLPEERRTRLHRRVAEHIEKTNGAKLGEMAARLAMHFDQGMEYSRAITYYQKAAENATSRYAGREALALATRGLQLLEMIPENSERTEREMCLQIALGAALMSARGLGTEELNRAFSRAQELFHQLSKYRRSSKKTLLFSALYGLWNYHWVHAEYPVARELADRLLLLAEAERDSSLLNQARRALGATHLDHGEFAEALNHLKQTTDTIGKSLAAIAKWHLGFPDQALKDIEQILTTALETRSPEDHIFAYLGAARVCMARRECKKTLDYAQSSLDLALQKGLVELWVAPMRSMLGWALAKFGRVNDGLEQARQALAVFHAVGTTNLKPLLSTVLAEISMETGQIEEGLAALEEALDTARSTDMVHSNVEIYRLRGELLLRQAIRLKTPDRQDRQLKEAESCFEQAVEAARRQQAKSLELRAITSLARLLLKLNRQAEVRERLTSIYRSFTEGHDTLDLREARALIQELS